MRKLAGIAEFYRKVEGRAPSHEDFYYWGTLTRTSEIKEILETRSFEPLSTAFVWVKTSLGDDLFRRVLLGWGSKEEEDLVFKYVEYLWENHCQENS